jgi:hypothetical protein
MDRSSSRVNHWVTEGPYTEGYRTGLEKQSLEKESFALSKPGGHQVP